MTDAALPDSPDVKKSGKMPLIIGLVLALVGGGAGFYASSSGLILAGESGEKEPAKEEEKATGTSDVSFIPMDQISISLPRSSGYKQLLFRAELEVKKDYAKEVETNLPRVIDVLNSYLRAIEVSDIEAPASLTRLRSQMLRRAQIVTGSGRVNDLLIMEFVLN